MEWDIIRHGKTWQRVEAPQLFLNNNINLTYDIITQRTKRGNYGKRRQTHRETRQIRTGTL